MEKKWTFDDDFTEEQKEHILKMHEEYEKQKKTFTIKDKKTGKIYFFSSNPSTYTIYGEKEYKKAVSEILADAAKGAKDFHGILVNLYAMQGYSEEELDKDLSEDNFEAPLSGVIDLELVDRFCGANENDRTDESLSITE